MGGLFLGPLASQSTISRLENAPSKTHGGAVVCATLMALKTLKSYFFFKHPQTLTSSIRKACARGNGVGCNGFSVSFHCCPAILPGA